MDSPFFARLLRFATFASLLLSAMVAIVLSEHMWQLWRPGQLPAWAPFVAPGCFALFLAIFACDRAVAVRRGQEVPARAVMQVGAAVFLLGLLAPQELLEMRRALQRRAQKLSPMPRPGEAAAPPADVVGPMVALLGHDDELVRASACRLLAAGWAPEDGEDGHDEPWPIEGLHEQVAALAQSDPSRPVRRACRQAQRVLSEQEPSGPDEAEPDEPGSEWL